MYTCICTPTRTDNPTQPTPSYPHPPHTKPKQLQDALDPPTTTDTPALAPIETPTTAASASTTTTEETIRYSYREQAAYLTILYLALILAIAFFLLRYANRSLFKWHTVRRSVGRLVGGLCVCGGGEVGVGLFFSFPP